MHTRVYIHVHILLYSGSKGKGEGEGREGGSVHLYMHMYIICCVYSFVLDPFLLCDVHRNYNAHTHIIIYYFARTYIQVHVMCIMHESLCSYHLFSLIAACIHVCRHDDGLHTAAPPLHWDCRQWEPQLLWQRQHSLHLHCWLVYGKLHIVLQVFSVNCISMLHLYNVYTCSK